MKIPLQRGSYGESGELEGQGPTPSFFQQVGELELPTPALFPSEHPLCSFVNVIIVHGKEGREREKEGYLRTS